MRVVGSARWGMLFVVASLLLHAEDAQEQAPPDILTVPADVEQPPLATGPARPGELVLEQLPDYQGTAVAHAVYVPAGWRADRSYPVVVEYLGNSAQVRDLRAMGYALTEGREVIWVVLPFVQADGQADAAQWWGDIAKTVAYAKAAVPAVCERWSGDASRVLLMGYSRGAIACQYVGLHDDAIASLWRAVVASSHYDDGHIPWGMSPEEQAQAPARFRRLGQRPLLILGEHSVVPQPWHDRGLRAAVQERHLTTFRQAQTALGLQPIADIEGTRLFVQRHAWAGMEVTWMDMPWINHTSQVWHRPTPERRRLRRWIAAALDVPQDHPLWAMGHEAAGALP